jgi:RNA polymerase sigma-70 factor (ECF subfamily)
MRTEEIDDSELVAATIDGNVASFEALYRRHSGRVYGLCIRLARNSADAQDCTQETFIKAWRQLETFRGGSSFGTWLHRIAVNEVLARKRRASTEDRHLRVVQADTAASGGRRDPDADLDELEQAIRNLPERAREAFVLHKIYGYTHEESAGMLNIAVGTCKSQVHRAAKLLGEALHILASDRNDATAAARVNADD